MLIPWQDLSPETLENLIESFVLREGSPQHPPFSS